MRRKPDILATRTVARSRLFHVEELELRFANGARARFERLKSSGQGAVLVVPMPDADHLLLIREYAAGTERYELGFPKGLVEPGEEPREAANRELMEEVGYGAHRIEPITSVTLAPGYLGHRTQVLLARDLYAQRRDGDEPEPIEVVSWPIARLTELLARDDFSEARSIAALFLVRERLNHESRGQAAPPGPV